MGKNVSGPSGSAEEPDKFVEATWVLLCWAHEAQKPVAFPGTQQGQVCFSNMESLLSAKNHMWEPLLQSLGEEERPLHLHWEGRETDVQKVLSIKPGVAEPH